MKCPIKSLFNLKRPDNATIHRIYSTLFNRESEYLTKIAYLKSTYANIPHVRNDYLPSVAKKALRYRINYIYNN